MKISKLWKFSSQIHTEIFLGSRIQSAGNNKEVILDKYQQNLNEIKSQSKLSSIIIASILIIPAYIAITTLNQSFDRLTPDNIQKVFFTNTMAIATYYLFNLIFMLLFGLMTIASLLKGHVFKFLHTLPFSKREIQLLGMMTFIRLLYYQLLIMMAVFPVGLFIISGSFFVAVIGLLINTGNIVISSYILIIIVDKLTAVLFSKDNRMGWRSFLRYLFLVGYIVSAFSIYYIVGTLGSLINQLYELNFLSEDILGYSNQVFATIGFPFATGYLISMLTLQLIPDTSTLIAMIFGLITYVIFMVLVVKKGNTILLNIAFKQPTDKLTNTSETHNVEIKTTGPVTSYLKMSLMIVSRDLSSLISLTLAILFPILTLLQGRSNQDPFVSFLFYSGFIIFFSSNALSASEGSIGGLLSSLPISQRMIFRVKQVLLAGVYFVTFILFSLISGLDSINYRDISLVLVLGLILPNLFLIFKSYFFGKINGEYTLFDVESDTSFFRNFGLIIPVMIGVGLEYALFLTDIVSTDLPKSVFIIGINVIIASFLEIVNRRMFR